MKLCYTLLFLASCVFGSTALAQDYTVNFYKGARSFDANVKNFDANSISSEEVWQNNIYRFVQFNAIPTDAEKIAIEQSGIELLEYIPNFTYIASLPSTISASELTQLNVRSVEEIDAIYKYGQRIQDEAYPEWAVTKFGTVMLSVALYDNVNFEQALATLEKEGVRINVPLAHTNMAIVEIMPSDIPSLVNKSFMKYVDIAPDPGTPESDDGRNLHRANPIDGDYFGSRQYDGAGIAVAVNDDGAVGPHIDYTGRVNQDDVAGDFVGDHGDMVAGIVGAAGNLDPTMRGMAPACYMHIRQYVSSMAGTMPLHLDSNVLIFQSSYSNGCNAGYTNTTVLVDQEIYENPTLMQVFSAGNSNNQNCGYGAGNQWGNITGGHKMGKNVIATANLDNDDGIVNSSSRGPANDGRIKPDIAAHGAGQMSTDPNNTYAAGGGTSAAAPGITGVMTQLHHAYQDMNGTTANSALLKAVLMNTANDLGNKGPDFIYGWGKVNGLKAVQLLEDGRYTNGSISQGATDQISINVPAGVEQVKVMVYWADKEASTSASTALVNDLDALLTDPNLASYQPWLLDHTPNATTLALPATVGPDHLNNVEQIAIDNPMTGTYTLDITGTTIPFGPQEYYVVWEFITSDITVTYPFGGEGLIPGSNDRIHWDANGTTGDFTLEYTDDNGASWNTIANNVNGADRIYEWNVPNIISGEVRVRVSRGGSQGESAANFSIMERPQNIEVYRVCESTNTVVLRWDPVQSATGYDIFMLGSQFMDSIGSATTEEFDVIVTDVADPQWFTVRAKGANGLRSNRQIAIYFPGAGGNGNCVLSCFSDSDVGVAALTEPLASFQSCSGNTTTDVVIDLENIGLFTESNFPVHYQLDNGAVITETYTGSLAPGGSATHTFGSQITFPGSGTYELKTWTGLNNDSTYCNDTITQIITVSSSIATFPLSEDFESGFPPSTAEVVNPDGGLTWEEVNTTGANGNATTATFINNFSYNAAGQEDELKFVNFDLSNVQSPATAILTFDVAYREYSSNYSDDMRIDVSGDCGQSYTQVYFKDGPTLATGPNSTSNWEPSSATDWRNDTIDLGAYIGGNAIVRFVNICGYGNNLFLDNINLEVQSFASVDELNSLHLTLMPNPANNETTVQFSQPLNQDTEVSVISMDGRVVWSQTLAKGTKSKTIDVSQWEAAVYTVRFASGELRAIRKIVIQD
ncbi:MAG: S8 family serine peptidase [Fluviicola sp.]